MNNKYLIGFPQRALIQLNELAAQEGVTKAEIVRRALSLYVAIYNDIFVKNKQLAIINDNDEIETKLTLA